MAESIKFVFSEFYSKNKIDVDMVKRYFPEADIKINTEENCESLFDRGHPRYGWRMNNYYQLKELLDSDHDITIALDADMQIVHEDVRTIIPLAKKFGFCLPFNNRGLVRIDTLIGADSDRKLDETNGTASAFNTAILAFDKTNDRARAMIKEAADIMLKTPMRQPVAFWRACYKTGFYPCLLPVQWCVCEHDEGCGNEIILHVGHESVRRYYHEHPAR